MRASIRRLFSFASGIVSLLLAAGPAGAGDRVTFAAGGGVAAMKVDWSSSATWEAWKETARLDARHSAASGPALQAAVGFRASRHFGVVVTLVRAQRDVAVSLDARVPHPLFLERPRAVTAKVSGRRYQELSTHVDFEWRAVRGPMEFALFAGSTFSRVETDLLRSITVTESYPYDEAAFVSAETVRPSSQLAGGWNAGGSAAWLVSTLFDLGLEARYARSGVELPAATGGPVKLNGGGLQVTARIRVRL